MFFNLGPLEIVVLVVVGLVVFGPEKLPGLARDAARMIRTLRELAQGARTQLRDELGPEFGDLDLQSLNPRTAITRALLGDDEPSPGTASGASASTAAADDTKPVSRPPAPPLGRDEAVPYDDDAT